ncbi:hypothetical protein SLE2022_323580 [Rubroshorea leprosula]
MAKEAGVQLLKIIGDSGLILGQFQGTFVVQEEHLAPYCFLNQNLEQPFANIRYEQVPQTKNWLADALATITSMVPMVENPFSVQVVQKERPLNHTYKSTLLELPDRVDCDMRFITLYCNKNVTYP